MAEHRSRRPLIGVTTSRRGFSVTLLWWLHGLCVRLAGGVPLRLDAGRDERLAARIDALIVGGGDDIGAELYGGEVKLGVKLDPERDALERRLLAEARVRNLPVMGVCRGCQMLNVDLGGSLHQEVREAFVEARHRRGVLAFKRVWLDAGSWLRAVLRADRIKVNGLHHQAIDRLGEGLRATIHDRHGIIQGIEQAEGASRLMIGVQWHPELLFYSGRQLGLYRALVAAARACSDQIESI